MFNKIFNPILPAAAGAVLLVGGCAGTESTVDRGQPPAPPTVEKKTTSAQIPEAGINPTLTATADTYLVGPGDVLNITVYEEPDISGNYRISRKGKIAWSWVGEIAVDGRDTEEIKTLLEGVLARDFFRDPIVQVDVEEYHSQIAYFFGNVSSPGIIRLGENRSLLENLLRAGGPQVGGESTITVLRTGGGGRQKFTIDLQTLLRGDLGEDILLQNGDIVTISAPHAPAGLSGENRIYVVGAVKEPGTFKWRENMTALDVLMRAGGLTDYASGNRSRITRGSGENEEEIPVRLDDILDGEKDKNIYLMPGDMLVIPESFF